MYNNPYMNTFNNQPSIDRINSQISELERMREQLQKPIQQPTNLTQNFQLAPTRDVMKYANSIDEVQREIVGGDTPFFSKDMSVLWVKNARGEVKTYELNEIVAKDEKDLKIDFLMAQIEDLKKEVANAKPTYEYVDEPSEDTKPTNVPTISKPTKKSK